MSVTPSGYGTCFVMYSLAVVAQTENFLM